MMEAKTYPAGSILFQEGDSGDIAYLVESGSVEISRGEGKARTVLGKVGVGAMFGEMALVSDQKRMATATATVETVCILVPREAFRAEMNKSSAFVRAMLFNLIGHVRAMSERLEEQDEKPPQMEVFSADKKGAYHKVD